MIESPVPSSLVPDLSLKSVDRQAIYISMGSRCTVYVLRAPAIETAGGRTSKGRDVKSSGSRIVWILVDFDLAKCGAFCS